MSIQAIKLTSQQLQDKIKMLITRILEKFIERFREYILKGLEIHYTKEERDKALKPIKKRNGKVNGYLELNPQFWDLSDLIRVFETLKVAYKDDFEDIS